MMGSVFTVTVMVRVTRHIGRRGGGGGWAGLGGLVDKGKELALPCCSGKTTEEEREEEAA